MRTLLPILWAGALVAQDPAPMKAITMAALIDNAWVTVRHITIQPGQAVPLHPHPEHVVVALSAVAIEETLEGGQPTRLTMKAGEVRHFPALQHSVKSLSATPMDLILVEFKPDGPATHGLDAPGATDDPKHAKVEFSNDHIRVLRWTIEGKGTSTHGHGHHVTVFLSAAKASVKPETGEAKTLEPKAGDALWTESLRHTVTNQGSGPMEAVTLEIRPAK